MKAVILAGGAGLRLRKVINDVPKPMAPVAGKPFLEYLILQLVKNDIKKIIISIGYKGEIIKDYFKDGTQWGVEIKYSEEDKPLGTGGALKKTEFLIANDIFFVLNGDSFCNVDFRGLLDFHINKKAVITIVLAQSDSAKEYGCIKLDESCRIIEYKEKSEQSGMTLINAGIYLMRKEIFSIMPEQKVFSLEFDFFKKLTGQKFYGYITGQEMLDIGSPERYEAAESFLLKAKVAGQGINAGH